MTTKLAACEYKTGKTLGQGSYASVKEAVKISTGEKFAVKVISKSLMAGREFMILNEIDILKKVSAGNPNIVTLHDYFETPNNLYLVMDLCVGGELFDRLCEQGSFYEKDASFIVKTVLNAVEYLHAQNIVHRDIKPENLLFKSKESSDLVLADFGLSKIMDAEKFDALMTTCGTPGYMAPEVLKKTGHGKAVDLWSIGVLTYFLLCGYTPFDHKNPAEEVHKIYNAEFEFHSEYWVGVSEPAKNFIRSLLVADSSKRLTATEALQHPWIVQSFAGDVNLMPVVQERFFNAKSAFKKAIGVVKMVNKMQTSSKPITPTGAITPPDVVDFAAQYRPAEESTEMVWEKS